MQAGLTKPDFRSTFNKACLLLLLPPREAARSSVGTKVSGQGPVCFRCLRRGHRWQQCPAKIKSLRGVHVIGHDSDEEQLKINGSSYMALFDT